MKRLIGYALAVAIGLTGLSIVTISPILELGDGDAVRYRSPDVTIEFNSQNYLDSLHVLTLFICNRTSSKVHLEGEFTVQPRPNRFVVFPRSLRAFVSLNDEGCFRFGSRRDWVLRPFDSVEISFQHPSPLTIVDVVNLPMRFQYYTIATAGWAEAQLAGRPSPEPTFPWATILTVLTVAMAVMTGLLVVIALMPRCIKISVGPQEGQD